MGTENARRPEVDAIRSSPARERRRDRRSPSAESATLSWCEPSGERRTASGDVVNRTPEGLALRLPSAIRPGQSVRVRWDLSERKARVCHCSRQEFSFLIGLQFLPQERRKDERLPANGPGMLFVSDGERWRRLGMVSVRNVSTWGFQLEVTERLARHQRVCLVGESYECAGWVRYYKETDGRRVAGIELARSAAPRSAPSSVN